MKSESNKWVNSSFDKPPIEPIKQWLNEKLPEPSLNEQWKCLIAEYIQNSIQQKLIDDYIKFMKGEPNNFITEKDVYGQTHETK